jgi:hypothetical protein
MDDFRVGATPRYEAYRNEQRPADSNRKKAARPAHPKNDDPEDEILVGQPAEIATESDEDLGVQDYYTPADRSGEPE